MVLKSARIALEWIVAVVAGVALLVGLGLFWLSREPLPVDFVAPYLEAALSRDDGLSVAVGDTQLVWAGWGSRIQVAGQDWRVYDAEGRRLATIPRASIELSLSALLEGQLAPTSIILRDLRISLLRRADGRFALGGEQPVAAAPDGEAAPAEGEAAEAVLSLLFAPLADKPDPTNPFAQLAEVTVVDASAILVDRRLDVVWRAPQVNLAIVRDPGGVSTTGAATIALGDKRSRLDLTMTQIAGAPGLETVVTIDSLEPSALAAVLEGGEPLRALGGALSGRVGMTIAEDGRPTEVVVALAGEALTIDLPERLEQPLVVRDLAIEARSEGLDQPLVLDRLTGSVAPAAGGAGPGFSVRAIVEPRAELVDLRLMAEVTAVPAADLALYWPKGVGGNGRSWVIENVTAGTATSATLTATLTLDRETLEVHAVDSFGGRFLYEDLEVHYLRPMPPLTGATGSAAFDLDGLDFTVAEARRDDIALGNGGISIFGLTGTDHRISIVFDASGPLRQALALLDHERLGLLDRLGLEPEAASGRFEAKIGFAFPLIDELGFEQIEIGVDGKVADVGLAKGVAGHDLEQGQFDLKLDSKSVSATGTATVAGIPLQAAWTESFEAVKHPTRVTATVPLVEVAQLATFGLEAGDYARGPLSAELDIAANHRGDAQIGVTANLQEVQAELPPLEWRKPAGQPAAVQAVLSIEKGELTRVEALSAELGADSLQGEVVLAPGGGFERVSLPQLTLGGTSVTDLLVTPYLGDGYAISVRGGVLDLAPLLGEDGEAPPDVEAETAAAEASGPPYTPLRLEAPALSRVRLARGQALEGVSLEVERDARGWQLIRAEAQIPRELWRHRNRQVAEDAAIARKAMSLHYRPEGDGTYRLELFADDIGATLRAVGWVDSIEGGRGEIVGTLPGPLPDAPLNARLETKGFRLVDAPAMAKLLTVASLTGIGNLLSGEGIEFDRAVGEFALADDMIRTPLFRAYGSSLGITAKGQIDLEADQTDIAGTLVPAYSVNRILGEIPLLGRLLTGGEGEGILGVTYRVTGRIEDPDVSVNPLSILAPGFLRGLFGVPRPDSDETDELIDVYPSGDVGR